jgi:uncharacterized Ntn-hydrolase superfamily protein
VVIHDHPQRERDRRNAFDARVCELSRRDRNGHWPLAQRLVAAMQAGERVGGDKRGRQSAALLIHGNDDWALLDLRVDDHADPLAELAHLEQLARRA